LALNDTQQNFTIVDRRDGFKVIIGVCAKRKLNYPTHNIILITTTSGKSLDLKKISK